jgi:DNA-binding NarL/FixJ family response regulator
VAQRHTLLRDALVDLLRRCGLHVVGSCGCPATLDRCLRAHEPDVALIDADLGELVEMVRAARSAAPAVRLVFLVPEIDPGLARTALTAEVDGVLLKSATSEDVVAALRRIIAGDAVFPAGWLAAARRPAARDGLSERQLEVLELLAQGLPNGTIAERLFISKNTVKFHIAAIYERLGVSNRVEAAATLRETG